MIVVALVFSAGITSAAASEIEDRISDLEIKVNDLEILVFTSKADIAEIEDTVQDIMDKIDLIESELDNCANKAQVKADIDAAKDSVTASLKSYT